MSVPAPSNAQEPLAIDLFTGVWSGAARTCGSCIHMDPSPINTFHGRSIAYCYARCTFEASNTPRGEPWAAEFKCTKFESLERDGSGTQTGLSQSSRSETRD